jgi:hypothetical protein
VIQQPAGNKAYADRLARDDPQRPPTAHGIIELECARRGMRVCYPRSYEPSCIKSCLVQEVSHSRDQAEQKDPHYGAH